MNTVNGSTEYASAQAFRSAAEDRLKKKAASSGRPLERLRREFLFQRFLSLVFSVPDSPWILKGGASLLMRLPHARYSKDLDLLHLGDLRNEEVVAALRAITAPHPHDYLNFVVQDEISYSVMNPVIELEVNAYTGTAKNGGFSIDLATELHLVAATERIKPVPVIEMPGLGEPPEIVVYPLPDQIADKVCAMYERHGTSHWPSTRFRDLVDLVLLVTTCELEAAPTCQALRSESRRRDMELPQRMQPPGPQWETGYQQLARTVTLSPELATLRPALELVGSCLNPLLDGTRDRGRWKPDTGWSG